MSEKIGLSTPTRALVAIRGPVCAGKSSVVEALERYWPDTASRVDIDVFKHQIDRTSSSEWRRAIALKSACFLISQLMEVNRTIISDIHSSRPDQYEAYMKLAAENSYPFHSFLLYPPLEVCLERNRQRDIPQVSYTISDEVIRQYWEQTYRIPGEQEFDTSISTPKQVAAAIHETIVGL